ncbi:hypothetical protein H0H87_010725 [Tephrocybe sp. NHM501043]|nr:hypothetical protein H0H87_010725 [Tephrocybe sp. NHM501043]
MRLLQALLAASVLSLSAYAHPALAPFVSVPLHPAPKRDVDALPNPIVHQQHANRAIRRLHSMVRAPNPASDDDLLLNLVKRADTLPADVQKRYYHPGLDYLSRLAAHYKHKSAAKTATGEASQSFAVDGNGTDNADAGATAKEGVTPAKKPTFSNTIGLDIQVSIGTPPRDFELLVDSGSADLWVGGEGCKPTDPFSDQEDCGSHNFLGSKSSSTFNDTKKPWRIEYGTGAVSGNLVTDVISFAGLKLPKHAFGVAYNESAEFTPNYIPFDGLLGLAKKLISRQGVPNLLNALVSAKKVAKPIASYHIPRLADGASNNSGELTLGGLNPARYDPKTLVSVPNISPFGFWQARIQSIGAGPTLQKIPSLANNRSAIFDTGTTMIIAPKPDVDALHKAIAGAEYSEDLGYWTVPCVVKKNAKPVLALTIGGREFKVDARDLPFMPVNEDEPNGKCMSGISEGLIDGMDVWLIGDVFLKNVYFVTNEETDQLSFANLKK